jgi:nucleoside-diphosphate-sugar epimerase
VADGTDKTMNRPVVLLTGATSQIGIFVIPRLLQAGFRIVAISRQGKPEDYPEREQLEWLTGISDEPVIKHCEYLLSAGPMELAIDILQTYHQLNSTVIFSSSSVITKRESDNPAERQQILEMLKLESELQLLAKARSQALVILRPSMIYGCGLDTNISRLARWIQRFGFLPVNGKAGGLRQPVHADDLASISITALQSDAALPGTVVLAGGSTLSYADMVKRIFVALNKPTRLMHLPQWLFVLLARVLAVFSPASGINSEMVRRQRVDLVFDNRQASELLGYKPRPFEPGEKDFSLPVVDQQPS